MGAKAQHLRKFIRKDKTVILEYAPDKLTIQIDTTKVDDVLYNTTIRNHINLTTEDQVKEPDFKEVKVPSNSQKMALFCSFFRKHEGQSYTPQKFDVKHFDGIPVNEKLLTAYFEQDHWWNKHRNIKNYCHNINNIKQLLVDKFPNKYDSAFAKTLSPEKLQDYWKHLTSLGWTYKSGRWLKA